MFYKSSCIHQNILLNAKYFMIDRIKILWSGKSSLCPDWPERTWDGSRSWHASAASNCPGLTNRVWWRKVDTLPASVPQTTTSTVWWFIDWKPTPRLDLTIQLTWTFLVCWVWVDITTVHLAGGGCRGELLPAPPSSCCLREKKKQWMESLVQSWGLPCARRNWNW